MESRISRRGVVGLALSLLVLTACRGPAPTSGPSPASTPAAPVAESPSAAAPAPEPATRAREAEPSAPERITGVLAVVEDVTVLNYDRPVHRGSVDLSATIRRIRAGESFPHRNDGAVFGNRERRLPRQPRGYYREYVHPTKGIRGPGPQRIVIGRGDEWYYTPDHYESFVRVK